VSNFHAIPQKLRNHDYFFKLNDEVWIKNNLVCFEFNIDYEPIKGDKAYDWLMSTMVSWSSSFNGLKKYGEKR